MRILMPIFILLSLIACGNNSQDAEKIVLTGTDSTNTQIKDTIGLEQFWKENIIPILDYDSIKLKEVINFPIEGSWCNDIGLKKTEDQVTPSEFFTNYNLLFDQNCIEKLKELDYNDVQVYIGDGYTQLIVSNGWELPYVNENGIEGQREGGIILRFKRFQNHWKLFSINSMK